MGRRTKTEALSSRQPTRSPHDSSLKPRTSVRKGWPKGLASARPELWRGPWSWSETKTVWTRDPDSRPHSCRVSCRDSGLAPMVTDMLFGIPLTTRPTRARSALQIPKPVGAWSQHGGRMSDHVYNAIELVGSSTTGIEDAVQQALTRASKTVRNMGWFQVAETRGSIENGHVRHWPVTLKVGFTLED